MGLSSHLLQVHGIGSDEESEGEEEEDVELMMRSSSRRNIPVHLDYREQDSSEDEKDARNDEMEGEVKEIDDEEEHSTPARKRDAVSAGMSESSLSKKKNKGINLSSSARSAIEQGELAPDKNNNYFEEVMKDFMKI